MLFCRYFFLYYLFPLCSTSLFLPLLFSFVIYSYLQGCTSWGSTMEMQDILPPVSLRISPLLTTLFSVFSSFYFVSFRFVSHFVSSHFRFISFRLISFPLFHFVLFGYLFRFLVHFNFLLRLLDWQPDSIDEA